MSLQAQKHQDNKERKNTKINDELRTLRYQLQWLEEASKPLLQETLPLDIQCKASQLLAKLISQATKCELQLRMLLLLQQALHTDASTKIQLPPKKKELRTPHQ